MPKLHPEVEKKFKELLEEAIKLSPSYSLLEDSIIPEDENDELYTSFESKIEEMVWQGFIYGLRVSREHDEIWRASCAHCTNSITETAKGEIVYDHDIVKEEGWVWNFDPQNWSCPDCATSTEDGA
jgi:hypothetical protein